VILILTRINIERKF